MNFGNGKKEKISIRFCGTGGMGVILVGFILGKAAIYEDKNAIQMQSYGASQRGSKVRSDVIISENEILYPIIDKADVLIAFSKRAFDYYLPKTTKNALVLINSDLIDYQNESIIKIPASKIARELNNPKVLNIVMLGAFIKKTEILTTKSIIKSINNTIPKSYQEVNKLAFNRGINLV
ncbi:MAG: 2-oxoacid:ferredoxin oxidoreductase subunit gamma [Candidatus Lokiarchaeota archaeon]|nr:2-oxoacid:ferredoxin oxidoreductase subunit gamma [Candidatus Lokiarchaeota archaeon]